ncbi:hypothetical protein [Umezawaea sp. Da 62-37]|uniref:hypothetical protein n=1 Tax=Umezawaea sp. Da 62-37 TaxID=3075927 RepID=UPI0028F6C972|nr:hypothetical protein [Umezawaea sp. Da 62-37]WNV83129.1 hypothetical protein RM788_33750 [Umezawaea sp. Da 62-37]
MSDYTVIGLIDRTTGVLEIAGVIPGHVITYDRNDNADTIRWSQHILAGDALEAETFAHYVHKFGGIPAEHRPVELTLGSVVVDPYFGDRRVRQLSLDTDIVRVWFTGDDDTTPTVFHGDATVHAVLTPVF